MNHISHGDIEITVANYGAELRNLRYQGNEKLYQKVDGFWQRQSPILFPIVGKLKGDTFAHEGKNYTIPQHGFLRDMEWKSEIVNQDELLFSVESNESTKEKYPWDFEVQIRYLIEATALRVEYTVTNESLSEMPVSIGGHPAFHIEGEIGEYSITFESDDVLEYDILDREQKGLLSGHTGIISLQERVLPLTEELFRLDALIFRNLQTKKVTLLKNGTKVFTFDRGNFPHFALWKQIGAPFLCFEPWQGYADRVVSNGKIQEKPGIVLLTSGETRIWEWSIDFSL